MHQFHIDNKWQEEIRQRILIPFYRRNCEQFIDAKNDIDLQMRGIDGFFINKGVKRSVEDKINRQAKYGVFSNFFLQLSSIKKNGGTKKGWMHTCEADVLSYSFHRTKAVFRNGVEIEGGMIKDGDTSMELRDTPEFLDCYGMNFRLLQDFFFKNFDTFKDHFMPEVEGEAKGKIVWIKDIPRKIMLWREKVPASLLCAASSKPAINHYTDISF